MIPGNVITAWSNEHPWPGQQQIEQDLLLSKAMCEIANDSLLCEDLALRGGTALHKLIMPKPYRYSEDLDYVRTKEGGIGEVMTRLTSLGQELGFSVKTRLGMFPKVLWRFRAANGVPAKIKIEINTNERIPVYGFNYVEHMVETEYYTGKAKIRTFFLEELMATKIRALYQRSKGRDLYDLWMSLEAMKADAGKIIEAFSYYRPDGLQGDIIVRNLREKMLDSMFVEDTYDLLRNDAPKYVPEEAGKMVISELLSAL